MFEGIEVNGAPEYVIFKVYFTLNIAIKSKTKSLTMMTTQGRLVTDQGLFRPMTGYGQFVPLPPFPPVLYDKVSLLLIMGDLIFLLKSSPSPSNKIREKKEFGSVCPVPRTEEDMATTNGVDQEIPPEVGIIWPMLEMIC